MTLLAYGTWIAVCDGAKAMLLENRGDHEYPKLEMRRVFEQHNAPTREQGNSKPGRNFSAAQGRHAALEETDFHDQAERKFLKEFAARINQQVAKSLVRFVIIAPPRALGMLRPHLADITRRRLLAELPHDYVKLPLIEIEKLLMRTPGGAKAKGLS